MTDPTPAGPPKTAAPKPSTPGRATTLPRELSDFLIEFSIALHKHAMYPGGHPTLEPAAAAVAGRLETLLADRGTLSLGVAREQLVIEGVATDPRNPVLHDLADRLHRHHLGAISFARGVSWEELEEALKLLAVDADRGEGAIGLRPMARIATWPHLRLYPITFDRLELVGDEGPDAGNVSGGRPAQLWVGLARAALAAEDVQQEKQPSIEGKPPEPWAFRPEPKPLTEEELEAATSQVEAAGNLLEAPAEPLQVAKAIEGHERGTAYDQVIVGYLLQIAEELKGAGGTAAVALKKKMSRLISALEPRTLERLLDMGGDLAQRRQFLLDASQGMAVDAVVDLVRAASGTGAPISNAMIRMLTKLGHHAERGPAPRRQLAETGLREQVAELVTGWGLADPNPGGYTLALQRMVQVSPTLVAAAEAAYAPEPLRVVQMAAETGAAGDPLERAVDELLQAGRLSDLLATLERAPAPSAATEMIRARSVTTDTLRRLLGASPPDFGLVEQLVAALQQEALPTMLDVLAESESRQVRRGIIDRLVRQGDALAPLLAPRLTDERWSVIRNILSLAAELPRVPPGLEAGPFRQHADTRVRREAMRVLFRHPVERTRAICAALTDDDPRTKRLALSAVGPEGWPEAAVPLLVTLASDREQDDDLCVSALRALAVQGGRLALDALLGMTVPKRRTIVGAITGAQASPVFLAAVTALGAYRAEPRARERLEALARGHDTGAAQAARDALKGTA